ncbi:MAG: hypothetical protein PHW87_00445 [Methanothrix sp.]|nr:hypothetical protein [Methanothrix sp.]
MITILILFIVAGSPAAAKCCSLGGGASYNFLGDFAMDIDMDSYDEFVRENVPESTVAVSDVKAAATSRLHLNLIDNSSICLLLSQAEGGISSQGNATQGNQVFVPGENLFMRRFIFILPAPPLMPLIAFCMA